ncbi:MAG: hypothetical protein ACREQ7_17355 [Candidatus Binatia bacterium]
MIKGGSNSFSAHNPEEITPYQFEELLKSYGGGIVSRREFIQRGAVLFRRLYL